MIKRLLIVLATAVTAQAATEIVPATRVRENTNFFLAFQPSNTTLQVLLEWLDANWYSMTNRMVTKSDLQQLADNMEQRFLTITNFEAYIASLPSPGATPDKGVVVGGGAVTQTIAITSPGTTNIAIPAGAKKLTFYCWGGGGGGRGGGASTQGGGGGFAFGSVETTNSIDSTTAGYVWTGATIRVVTAAGGAAGYGGGYTRISMVTNSYERHYLVAGGGGGGGYVDPEADNYPGGSWQGAGNGGGGGGTNGIGGISVSRTGTRSPLKWEVIASRGGGGAQAASGGGGNGSADKWGGIPPGEDRGCTSSNGTSGSSWSGGAGGIASAGVCGPGIGNCNVTEQGGGGGAGYNGGGGGGAAAVGWSDSVFQNAAGGGGGGSGYINTSFVTDGYLDAANGKNPPRTDLWAYAVYSGGNRAVGGSATSGYPGLVVIIVE
jgi:hypothetical protein